MISDFTTTLDFDGPPLPPPVTVTQQIPWTPVAQDGAVAALRAEVGRLERSRYMWRCSALGALGALVGVLGGFAVFWFDALERLAVWLT